MNIFNNLFKKQTSSPSKTTGKSQQQQNQSQQKSQQKAQQYSQPSNPWAAEENSSTPPQSSSSIQSTAVSNLSNPPSMNSLKQGQANDQQAPKASGGMFGKLKKNKATNSSISTAGLEQQQPTQSVNESIENNSYSSPAHAAESYTSPAAEKVDVKYNPPTDAELNSSENGNAQVSSKKPLFAKFRSKTQNTQQEADNNSNKEEEQQQEQQQQQQQQQWSYQQPEKVEEESLKQSIKSQDNNDKQFEGLSFIEKQRLKKKLAEEKEKQIPKQTIEKEEEKIEVNKEETSVGYIPQCFQESSDEDNLTFKIQQNQSEEEHAANYAEDIKQEQNNESQKEQNIVKSGKLSFLKRKTQENNNNLESEKKQEEVAVKERDFKGEMAEEKKTLALRLTEVVLAQHQLMSTKSRLEAERKRLQQKQKDLQKLQNQHVENDRFEEAEAIEEQIKETLEEIQSAERSSLDAQNEYNSLDTQKEQIHQDEISQQERWLTILSDLKKNKVHEREEYESEMNQKLKKERKEIEEEQERINIRQEHLELDSKQLLEERENIKESVAKQCGDLTVEQQAIDDKEKELSKEVEELRRQLEIKEQELLEVQKQAEDINSKILSIQQKFENQERRLDTKAARLSEEQRQFDLEVAQLKDLQKKNELNQLNFTDKLKNLQEMTDNYHSERNLLSEQILQNKRTNEARESALSKFADSYAGYIGFNKTLEQDELQAESFEKAKSQLDEAIAELQAKASQLQDKIPVLENEKKALVAQKAFKQAGLIANDIKDVIAQVEETAKEIDVKKKQEQQVLASLEQIQQRKASSDNQLRQLKKLAELDKYTLLLLKIKDLQELKAFSEEQRSMQSAETLQDEIIETESEIERIKKAYPEEIAADKKKDERKDGNGYEVIKQKNDSEPVNQKEIDQNESINNNSQEDEDGENSDTSNQLTEADLDSKLKDLVARIKDLTTQLMQHEDSITHCVEAEEYEKADSLQQVVDKLTAKLEKLNDKLNSNYGCLNLEEAEALILKGGNTLNNNTEQNKNETTGEQEKQDLHICSEDEEQNEEQNLDKLLNSQKKQEEENQDQNQQQE